MVFYALGLVGHATVEIVDRVFYSRGDTRTPVLAAVLAVAINIVASLVLMQTGLGFRGLALANSIAALIEGSVLIRLISNNLPGLDVGRLATPAVRILAASLVMGLPVAWLAGQLDPLLRPYGTPGQGLLVATCIGSGALLYGLVSLAFRSDELHALRRLVQR
jgi:putative peptidoglycan lipid II flippase